MRYCLTIFLIIVTGSAFCQPIENIDNLKPAQLLKFGKNYEKVGDLYGAIEFYSRYYDIKYEKIEVAHRLAKLYIQTRNYQKARDYYQRCFMSDPRYIEYLFYHAQMQKATGNYKGALENFKIFEKQYKGRDRSLKKQLAIEMQGCENAQLIKNDSLKVAITHLPPDINKAHIELSPVLKDENTLIFSALREDAVNYYNQKDKPVRKFYTAAKKGNNWVFEGELKGNVNSNDYNTGNGTFSTDGKRFYFTRCQVDWKNEVHCKIFISEVNGNNFSEPVEVENVNDAIYSSTQPTIGIESKKGTEVLYFVSNRPRGKGGLDIWYATYDSRQKTFSKPRNAGTKINTEGNEVTPFYDMTSGKMYFSSDGWPGLGGYDIFETMGDQTKWLKPKNAGYPVNSSYDDQYYVVSKNKIDAFFTSNRPGGTELHNPTCCDDLYNIVYLDQVILELSGRVYAGSENMTDAELEDVEYIKNNLISGADVQLYLISDEVDEPILVATDTTDKFGKYNFFVENNKKYQVQAKKNGYFPNKVKYSTVGVDIEKKQIVKPSVLKVIPKKAIRLANIYYQYDKWTLTPQATSTIDTTLLLLLNDMPDIIVEISAHTDSKGEDEYNLKLSQKRAQSVVDYLIEQGIDKNRLIAKGYGESEPFKVDRLTAMENDFLKEGDVLTEGFIEKLKNRKTKEAALQINRRTEFTIVGSSDINSIFYINK